MVVECPKPCSVMVLTNCYRWESVMPISRARAHRRCFLDGVRRCWMSSRWNISWRTIRWIGWRVGLVWRWRRGRLIGRRSWRGRRSIWVRSLWTISSRPRHRLFISRSWEMISHTQDDPRCGWESNGHKAYSSGPPATSTSTPKTYSATWNNKTKTI